MKRSDARSLRGDGLAGLVCKKKKKGGRRRAPGPGMKPGDIGAISGLWPPRGARQ